MKLNWPSIVVALLGGDDYLGPPRRRRLRFSISRLRLRLRWGIGFCNACLGAQSPPLETELLRLATWSGLQIYCGY